MGCVWRMLNLHNFVFHKYIYIYIYIRTYEEIKFQHLNVSINLLKIRWTNNVAELLEAITFMDEYKHRFWNKVCINIT